MNQLTAWTSVCLVTLAPTTLFAQETTAQVAFSFNGAQVSISQSASPDFEKVAAATMRASDCTALCLSPMKAADGVMTIAEPDVLQFVATQVANGDALLIDSRGVADRASGAITTSINLPSMLLEPTNPYQADILVAMGARSLNGILNFADAMPVVVYDNGPLAQDAQQLISQLLDVGYPADRIYYYRGGMQVWNALGLSVEETQS